MAATTGQQLTLEVWDAQRVGQWVASIGFQQYEKRFRGFFPVLYFYSYFIRYDYDIYKLIDFLVT
jgi:hypothetical protein